VPEPVTLARNALATLPFTLTSIIFLQTLSPMASSYRSRESSPEVARRKALRAMTIAFGILFVAVVFFAISFALALGPARAQEAFRENISALALAAKVLPPGTAVWLGAALNIFALVTAFFGVYLGFHEAVRGITLNLLIRVIPEDRIPSALIDRFIQVLAIALAFTVTRLEIPVLYFTTASGPLFGIVGCIIPVCLVLKAPALAPYRHLPVLAFITLAGILLILLPFMGFL
jgi:amino acid permease